MKYRRVFFIVALTATMAVYAKTDSTTNRPKWLDMFGIEQTDSTADKPTKCSLYGFIRTDLFAQTREMQSVVQELMPLYVSPADINKYGEDVNNEASVGMYSMTTRLGLKLNGDGVLGAERMAGCIEADFTAGTNCTSLYLRKAFVQLFWKKSDLLIGQSWHPLCTEKFMPATLSINVGAPYAPFSRNPQLRYTYHLIDDYNFIKLDLLGAIVYQGASTSVGPDESDWSTQVSSSKFQKNAIIPNVYLGAEYSIWRWTVGGGVDYKAINPVKNYTNYEGEQKKNNHLLNTVSAMVYGDYTQDLLDVSAKIIYGSNLCEHKLIGGYAVGQRNVTVGDLEGYVLDFVPFRTLSSYITASYGKLLKGNLLIGYAANFGPTRTLNQTYTFYGNGKDGNQIARNNFRIGLSATYNPNHWCFGVEIQYNHTSWSKLADNGKFTTPTGVGGLWFDAAAIYTF